MWIAQIARLLQRWDKPRKNLIDWGDLRRLEPLSREFGQDRGTTVRRYYIERFLETHKASIGGHVLEVGDDRYARRYARSGSTIEILDPDPSNSCATLRGNLMTGEGIPSGAFDVIILTQVLHVLVDMDMALDVTHRALAPGGVMLATLPGISQVSRFDMDRWGDYWRVTDMGAAVLAGRHFAASEVRITSYGNVLAGAAALWGIAAEELTHDELDVYDQDFPVLIGIAAHKSE